MSSWDWWGPGWRDARWGTTDWGRTVNNWWRTSYMGRDTWWRMSRRWSAYYSRRRSLDGGWEPWRRVAYRWGSSHMAWRRSTVHWWTT